MTEKPIPPKFAGKAVLITGSSRGIGKATARAFLEAGARVALNGRGYKAVEETITELGGHDRLVPAVGNLRSVGSCEAVVGQAIDAFGRLDVLVNNVGIYRVASIEASDEGLWNEIMDVNLKATFFCSRAALRALRASRGCVVNVASVNGLVGSRNASAYCAAKGGVVNLTRAMAMELAPDVRVNSVCPAAVDTEMGRQSLDPVNDLAAARQDLEASRPLRRIAAPAEVAAAIAYLASDDTRYMTGAALTLGGGITAGA